MYILRGGIDTREYDNLKRHFMRFCTLYVLRATGKKYLTSII